MMIKLSLGIKLQNNVIFIRTLEIEFRWLSITRIFFMNFRFSSLFSLPNFKLWASSLFT